MDNIYIDRNIENTIREAANYFSVISVTGARQTGKSTLLRHLFPDYQEYSMKDIHLREYATKDPVAFLNQTTQGIFIDEVQLVPQLLDYIQGIVDRDPRRRFALSGSSNFEVVHGLCESLPGRAGVFDLLPMSLGETCERRDGYSDDDMMFEGFYPAVCAGKNKAEFFYPSYVKTYLERDVRDLLHVQDQRQFSLFMMLCAARVGSIFNASQVAAEVGVDSKTVTRWLSVLEASCLVTLLPPYYENISKRLVKSPKLYFNDPGLACHLLDIESAGQLRRDKMRGALFENMVVMEVLKHRCNRGRRGGVFFYRDANQNEVDILLKEEGVLTAIEVKSSQTYNSSYEGSLRKIGTWIQTPVERRAVVYAGDYENTAADIQLLNYRHLGSLLGD